MQIMDILPICGIAALIVGSAIGAYIGILEARERAAILEKANGNKYIGTSRSKIFHYYTCGHVKKKYRKGKEFEITFTTIKDAENADYKPCRQCLDRL